MFICCNIVIHMIALTQVSASPEKALLAQVVLLSISDACMPPPKGTRLYRGLIGGNGMMMKIEAFTAMRFLFDENVAGLNEYAIWLDIDANVFRTKLLKLMADATHNDINTYTSMQRRAFRINYKLWQNINTQQVIEWSDDDLELDVNEH